MATDAGAERDRQATRPAPSLEVVADGMSDALVVLRALRADVGTIIDFAFDYANGAVSDQLGVAPGDLVGSTLLTVQPEFEVQEAFARFVATVECGEVLDVDAHWHLGNRVLAILEIRGRRFDDGLILTICDVSERRAKHAVLTASDAHARQVIESLPVGIAFVDASGTSRFANAAGRRLLGAEPGEVVDLVDSPTKFALYRGSGTAAYPVEDMALARAIRTGAPAMCDDITLDRDGVRVPIESHAIPLFDPDGSIAGAVSVFEDVSHRREQEELLARALAELTAANQQLGEFAAMAAHDLAAPLRAIAGFAELLGDRHGAVLDRDAREWIEFIQADASRMRMLIDDLLAYARAGAAAPPTTVVDLAEVATAVIEALGDASVERNATLHVEALPSVVGDAAALFVVLRNLISNALKFGRTDEPNTVRISATRDRDEWVVTVADTGLGVPTGERDQLFVPFHRGEASASRAGNGLGLSICRRIVEYHGGQIRFEPNPGGGATFWFTVGVA